MITQLKSFLKTDGRYLALAFFLPLLLMAFVYLLTGIYPGSSRSILASDAFSQFSNFHAAYRNMLLGKDGQGLFYTWNASLGLNFFALASYYLGGLITPAVIFFPNNLMPDALYFITLIKIGLAGAMFWFYARRFKAPKLIHVAFSVAYAMMAFIGAHSELLMWLDAFIYLPLIILGIEKLQDEKKPLLLFVSYFLMFISNFYFGFMVGLFSFLYFFFRTFTNWHRYARRIVTYLTTSLLAGGTSMLIILPTYLDLKTNGEALTTITKLKTEATAPFDILMKNMIGVYDTTKYGSIPFIYIGLIPLIFCLFYFITKKVPLKNKLAFGALFAVIITSFYFVPFNLFWHGMHAPNMFLFRYSFTFSFLVIALALRSFRLLERRDFSTIALLCLLFIAAFLLGKGFLGKSYSYITLWSLVLTVVFLVIYGLLFLMQDFKMLSPKMFAAALLIVMASEATINMGGMVKGILDDWNYASRSLYTEPAPEIKMLVDDAKTQSDSFYRLENLDPVSSNDGFNYGYSSVSMFSSIRNRNSSSLLNDLGFRSTGTNLNIRYNNNTLLMDNLVGVEYNIAKNNPFKAGFTQTSVTKNYQLYQNKNALPLGILTDSGINNVELPKSDNLVAQKNLFNYLAGTTGEYFQFAYPTVTAKDNTTMTTSANNVTFTEQTSNVAKTMHYQIAVPAGKQAYLSLYPTNYNELESSTATIFVNGTETKSQINISGQYYNLGYYPEATTVDFSVSFYGTDSISFINPPVILLDVPTLENASAAIQEKGVNFTEINNGAKASVDLDTPQTVFTTIPYDLGWTAYVDGKKVDIKAFKDAFVTFDVKSGKHEIVLKFVPAGFKLGVIISLSCLALFIAYMYYLRWRRQKQLALK